MGKKPVKMYKCTDEQREDGRFSFTTMTSRDDVTPGAEE